MKVKENAINTLLACTPLLTFGAVSAFLHFLGADQPVSLVLLAIGAGATMWMLYEWQRWNFIQAQWKRDRDERIRLEHEAGQHV